MLDPAHKGEMASRARISSSANPSTQPKDTIGKVNQRRRRLLTDAGAANIEARIVFEGHAPHPEGCPSPGAPSPPSLCIVCNGTGETSPWLTPEMAVAAGTRSIADMSQYDCGICYGDGEFCIASGCGEHYYCRDCITGHLTASLELGHPLECPACKASADKERAARGRVDEQSLTFLQARGAISRELMFRSIKHIRSANAPPSAAAAAASSSSAAASSASPKSPKKGYLRGVAHPGSRDKGSRDQTPPPPAAPSVHTSRLGEFYACPAGCGNYLAEVDPSYVREGSGPKLGEFFEVPCAKKKKKGAADKNSLAVRCGRCPCAATPAPRHLAADVS